MTTVKLYESTEKNETIKQYNEKMNENLTHAYAHWRLNVHLAGFAPAFTLSFHDSECSRKPPVPIASVVMCKCKKKTFNCNKTQLNNTKL